ncbi:hypothetical protein HHI36_012474 [Cryptolaemus montrouzieri]|uniref:Beta-galactosidase n=1 Tax=Cryptolaemus montrouzieri TaxID=559131 RepID=A0ABD2NEQ6_9CUCU
MSSPTLYKYYTLGGIKTGLSATGNEFTLNNRPITIFSGAIHYFRVHPDYWKDRLRKLKYCGLNCVETYIPWNLHEPQKDNYDFGAGNNDMTIFCQIEEYIKLAQEEDLFVIIRPGPYICAEWEFGGMPSYLLREENLTVRTSDPRFVGRVEKYFQELFKVLTPLQFTNNGSIIAFQIENEYGNVEVKGKNIDTEYLLALKNIMEKNGVKELLFTSDTPSLGFSGTVPDVLATANFQENAVSQLQLLKNFQPNRPLMVMEFWTGWFDHWTESHQTRNLEMFTNVLEEILKKGSSVNFYMFHGGTNWGFLNGANCFGGGYQADTTSYDYDCLLSEDGSYTEKYHRAKELIKNYQKVLTKSISEIPPHSTKYVYPSISVSAMMKLSDILKENHLIKSENSDTTKPMELLSCNNDSGQSFGYIVYRKTGLNIPKHSKLRIEGKIRDQAIVLLNGVLKSKQLSSVDNLSEFGYWQSENSCLSLNNECLENATVDIIISNWGRINFGKLDDFKQHKGLFESVISLNEQVLLGWTITPLEFKKNWNQNLSLWQTVEKYLGPSIYKFEFNINVLQDTYIDMREWCQGIIIINGFVLGRYCKLGPQYTLYLPAPLLNDGFNTILVFEHFESAGYLKFTDSPIWNIIKE